MIAKRPLNRSTSSIAAALACVGLLALAVLALPGCGSAPPAPSHAEEQAVGFNRRAERAFARGDYVLARRLYEQALRIDISIENADGIALNALSLARVHQALGEPESAQRYLDGLLAGGPPAPPNARLAEAAARKAQILLDAGKAEGAAEWAAQAQALCRGEEQGCASLPAILNLRARTTLALSNSASALDWGSRALAAAAAEEARVERANAHRVIGEARMARNEYDAAARSLVQALELDRKLGLPGKIFLDLMLLGRAEQALGNASAARSYFARALAVSTASDNAAGTSEAKRLLGDP